MLADKLEALKSSACAPPEAGHTMRVSVNSNAQTGPLVLFVGEGAFYVSALSSQPAPRASNRISQYEDCQLVRIRMRLRRRPLSWDVADRELLTGSAWISVRRRVTSSSIPLLATSYSNRRLWSGCSGSRSSANRSAARWRHQGRVKPKFQLREILPSSRQGKVIMRKHQNGWRPAATSRSFRHSSWQQRRPPLRGTWSRIRPAAQLEQDIPCVYRRSSKPTRHRTRRD